MDSILAPLSLEDGAGIIGLAVALVWLMWLIERIKAGKVKSNRQLEMDILRRRKK